MARLSYMGTEGIHTGHVARDLMASLRPNWLDGAMTKMTMNLKVAGRQIAAPFAAVLPHKLFSVMWHENRELWQDFWGGGDLSKLRDWWGALPRSKQPPRNQWNTVVPIKLFGDGVCVLGISKSWGKSCHAYLLCPMLTKETSRCNQVLLSFLWKKSLTAGSLDKWWQTLKWSFDSLASGKWPWTDPWGQAFAEGTENHQKAGEWLAEGRTARLMAITGDLEFLASGYGLRSPNSLSPCSKCQANSTCTPWTDSQASALWRRIMVQAPLATLAEKLGKRAHQAESVLH